MTLPSVSRHRAGGAISARATPRGSRRRADIVTAASELFAKHGFANVGMDDIGAAVGVTGPAIYRHFDSKAAVLAAVIDTIIDAVAPPAADEKTGRAASPAPADPTDALRANLQRYAAGVAARRELMAIFVREVHHLPTDLADRLKARQRTLVTEWRALLVEVHPTWAAERIRTAVHATFGIFNSVGTFTSPLSDPELAGQLMALAAAALQLPDDRRRQSAR